MSTPKIVSQEKWLEARRKFLKQEKEFTKKRDQVSKARRNLPWVTIEKDYRFDGPKGQESLSELFDGRSQLVVYHFMYGTDWEEGCVSCSFWADNFNGIDIHLRHRDVTLLAISKAPYSKLEAYKKRMGWSFKWVSSATNDFNQDFHVSFSPEEVKNGKVYYNYTEGKAPSEEMPGISVFYKNEQGKIFHTYSTYARGLDMLNGAYHFLDLVPKGRDEEKLSWTMEWLHRHDEYDDVSPSEGSCHEERRARPN